MLKRIRVAGWKSIKEQTIELTPMNVVIGANGAGKSNLISLFRLLNSMFANTPDLRNYVGRNGSAESLLHYGSRQTPVAEIEFTFSTHTGETTYLARWAAAARGSLIFTEERVDFLRTGAHEALTVDLGAGHSETRLLQAADDGEQTATVALKLLRSCRLFHFHDTSDNSAFESHAMSKQTGSCIQTPEIWRQCFIYSGKNILLRFGGSTPRCGR